jgi:hypothetical protein
MMHTHFGNAHTKAERHTKHKIITLHHGENVDCGQLTINIQLVSLKEGKLHTFVEHPVLLFG